MNQNHIKALSIQISLNGLSFCILNRSNNTIEQLHHKPLDKKSSPFDLLNQLKEVFDTHIDSNQAFDTITCIYQNELSCLVPDAYFDENNLADYLKFNAKILKTDYISYDSLSIDCKNVYVPLVNINNYIFETFGSFDYKHASTVLIETILQKYHNDNEPTLFVNVNPTSFEIVCMNGDKLIFYNTFEYSTKEDFIYYILFTIEQLELDTETIKTVLSGSINEDDALFGILYKYVRFVELMDPKYGFDLSKIDLENADRHHFILLNSFN
ncbi:MAG: DUF3822 family protein [Algicola sp.]|nr:DUF3822 family protein [Algicola sp.]